MFAENVAYTLAADVAAIWVKGTLCHNTTGDCAFKFPSLAHNMGILSLQDLRISSVTV